MPKVQWLGDAVSDCKASLVNKLACESFAGTVSIATGSYPLQQFYKDQCIEYLCVKGTMPDSPQDLPQPPNCKEDQANRDKCAAFASGLAVVTGSPPLGPFYRDQCLEYLCANGQMPTPQDVPPPPSLPPPPPPPEPPPQTKPSPQTPVAPAGAAPSTSWGWIIAGTAAALGLAWYFVPVSRPWRDNPWTRSLPHETSAKLRLVRVRLNQGGYDERGRYWGVGAPLYAAEDNDGNARYVRAATREAAKKQFPNAKWYRAEAAANPSASRPIRYTLEGSDATFKLRDYLIPHGRYPYEQLAGDMEMAWTKGLNVYLLSVPDFLMVSAVQRAGKKPWDVKKPWCVDMSRKCYRTAAEAIRG